MRMTKKSRVDHVYVVNKTSKVCSLAVNEPVRAEALFTLTVKTYHFSYRLKNSEYIPMALLTHGVKISLKRSRKIICAASKKR